VTVPLPGRARLHGALAEQVDPEKWHAILDRFFQILSDGIHRFEGTVNQYTGDGIMVLFGAPIAHEDHARRACYAALHLRDELQRYADELRRTAALNFSVRMGNSGEVVVGKIGDDLRMDYTAQGHTVGLVARMEQMVDSGKALLTAHTAKLVSGYAPVTRTRSSLAGRTWSLMAATIPLHSWCCKVSANTTSSRLSRRTGGEVPAVREPRSSGFRPPLMVALVSLASGSER
jgi:class 3 adenylate cyclase